MINTETFSEGSHTKYQAVAARISQLIERGTFLPGTRIPSVRGLSRQLHVSVTTVMEAYRVLEDQGLIEARPQSGYFVRMRSLRLPQEPEIRYPDLNPTNVNLDEQVSAVMRDLHRPARFAFGGAVPNSELLPISRLNRALLAVAREFGLRGSLYDSVAGCEELRIQIARRALDSGCIISPDEVIITSGCQQAVLLSVLAVCRPGDTVAVESPTYYGMLQIIEMLGLKAVEIGTYPKTGMCLDLFREVIDRHPVRAVLLVSNFSNPLGSTIPDEKKEKLVNLLAEHEIPLIEDDIYGDLGFSGERPKAAKAFDRSGNVLLCSSFSKTIAPGYRVGWAVPGRHMAALEKAKFVSNISSATLPQLAIAEFLSNGGYDHHLRRIRRTYAQNVTQMADAVGEYFPRGTRVTRPAGGFVLWVEMPEAVDSIRLYAQAREAGISVTPSPLFSARKQFRNCIRLNAAQWSPKSEGALATLGNLAASQIVTP
jgi:DNA-binding transcriptional MocR family regulator